MSHPGFWWHAGGGHFSGSHRWLPGGGQWDAGGHYVGGQPSLVDRHGRIVAGRLRGGYITPTGQRSLQDELDARAAEHERKVREEESYRRAAERESVAEYLREARAAKGWIKGRIRPDRETQSDKGRGVSRRNEWRELPAWARHQRGGLTMDVAAERMHEEYPGLGVDGDSNNLVSVLGGMDAKMAAARARLKELGPAPRRRRVKTPALVPAAVVEGRSGAMYGEADYDVGF